MCSSFVYIVASGKQGEIFTGMTADLVHQVWLHRQGSLEDLGAPAACSRLVWYRAFDTPAEAEAQLARLARWPQGWLDRLIGEDNADWADLWITLDDQPTIGLSPSFANAQTGQSASAHYPILRPMLQVA